MTKRGLYIVIEGGQGTGKSTQADMLARAMRASGLSVKIMREPDAQTDPAARHIRKLTQDPNYELSKRTEVLLYNAARSQTLAIIKQYTDNGIHCIVDRNYISTFINQYYLDETKEIDYSDIDFINGFATSDIAPDVVLVLDISIDKMLERKRQVNRGERFDDLNTKRLTNAREGYLKEATARGIPVVDASRSKYKVHQEIVQHTQYALENNRSKIPAAQTAKKSPQAQHAETTKKTTLANAVTNTESDVYAFTGELNPSIAAAAMARLSRRGDDMRTILQDEFIGQAGKDEALLKRVITAYGDDSVQQLNGIHAVVEGASNLLTKKLEWGRLAAYLEQSTRYIYYDEKDSNGNYKYVVPKELKKGYRKGYRAAMDSLFDRYSLVVRSLYEHIVNTSDTPKNKRDGAWRSACKAQACDAARGMLPVASRSTVGIYASAQAYDNLIMRLQADPTAEARETAAKLLKEVRKVAPAFFERTDQVGRGAARSSYMFDVAQSMKEHALELPMMSELPDDVSLTSYYPRNELDIVGHMLYEHTDISETEIMNELQNKSYDEKARIFSSYIGERLNRRMKPGRAFERISYSFDIVCDYGSFRDLQRHRMVSDLSWQELTPRYGFDIPKIIEAAGLTSEYESCFDDSAALHSKLFEEYGSTVAQYATLLGHRMRWKLTMNAREAFHFIELRSTPQGHPSYRKIAQKMHALLQEVHPLTAQSMRFVNKDEDPKLTRLAAERYAQSKLAALQVKDSHVG